MLDALNCFKILTTFILTVLSLLTWTCAASVCKTPNTGSVLFRRIDVHRRQCWAREELALLYTRRALMELTPRQIPHNVPLILEYARLCLATLQELATSEPVYDYMLAALADVLGGYLQTYGLPLLREAYYEGYVSYDTASEFRRMQESFKSVLMTNGDGWARPMEVRKHISRILPLKMPSTVGSKPCALLLTDAYPPQKCAADDSQNDNQTNYLIPLPILDDYKQPNSIGIPFKNRALFNLKSRNSYDILIKYYIEASRCISKAKKTGLEQSEFDHVFLNWLKNKVEPRLKDDVWYVGFSNVLRIQETIQQREGMISASSSKKDKEDESLFSELQNEAHMNMTLYLIILVILLVSILCICFLYWSLIRNCVMCCGDIDVESTRDGQDEPSDSTSLLSASEYEESSGRGRGRRPCKHQQDQTDSSAPQSPRSASHRGGGTLTMACGLGKGGLFRSHKR